jgi:hypothetical protein
MTKRELNPVLASTEIELLALDAKDIKSQIDKLQRQLEKKKIEICTFMKDKEDLINEDGEVICSWAQPNPTKRFDAKRFKCEHGDLYDNYIVEIPTDRRFVLK